MGLFYNTPEPTAHTGQVDNLWRHCLLLFLRGLKAIFTLRLYFHLITSISYVMELEQRMKSTLVNKKYDKIMTSPGD